MNKARLGWIATALVLGFIPVMYLLNPFNSNLLDPRARILGATVYRAPAEDMTPTIRRGAIFFVNVATLRNRDPEVGEVIAFKFPPNPEVMYLKRVVATGGMTIEMRAGVIWLDGERLEEPWLPRELPTETVIEGHRIQFQQHDLYTDMPPTRIPERHFFVLGDNRGNSSDSRSWGTVPRELVIGIHKN